MEEWRAIEGTDGRYEVSNTGKVRSRDYKGTGKIKELKVCKDHKGYQRVRLCRNHKKWTIKVHREVAKAFIPNLENKDQVNHKDGNRENNNVDNLEWVTNEENMIHAMKGERWKNVLEASTKTNTSRMRAVIATNIQTGRETRYNSVSEAEKAIGTKHIVSTINGKENRKQSKGYTFRYDE